MAAAVATFNDSSPPGCAILTFCRAKAIKLSLLPSGVVRPGKKAVIGNGVVVDPGVLLSELKGLEDRGVDTERLLISADAHLLMPYHVAIDKVVERWAGSKKIGTTGYCMGGPFTIWSAAAVPGRIKAAASFHGGGLA